MERPHSIKDTNNLLNYTTWSGGDYSNNLSGILTSFTLTRVKNYSSNGDYSIQAVSDTNGYAHMRLGGLEAVKNETYMGSINIYNNTSTQVSLRLIEPETNQNTTISIPPNNSMQKITVSHTLTDTSSLIFYLILREPTTVYIDNITLRKQ